MRTTSSVVKTLIEMGDRVSRDLFYAYQDHVGVSLGEETITESCLLELKRKHPKVVEIETFSKAIESKTTGADWEWHFKLSHGVYSFRVQAKRVTKQGSISGIQRKSRSATKPQADLLIEDADRYGLFPLHCFYCCNDHQKKWKTTHPPSSHLHLFEHGCLIADARTVRRKHPKKLSEIENATIPWHFMFARKKYLKSTGLLEYRSAMRPMAFSISTELKGFEDCEREKNETIPNILEGERTRENGFRSYQEFEMERGEMRERAQERAIERSVAIDLRGLDFFLERKL